MQKRHLSLRLSIMSVTLCAESTAMSGRDAGIQRKAHASCTDAKCFRGPSVTCEAIMNLFSYAVMQNIAEKKSFI
jgi:hypothetical protein